MNEDGRPVRRRREKMHRVFVELYLSPDDDQADDRGKGRKRRSALRKRVIRRERCD
jgi:hypothetical protein